MKDGKKARQRCGKQRGPCQAFVRQGCGDDEACIAARARCRGILANCTYTAFVECFNDTPENGNPRPSARATGLLR